MHIWDSSPSTDKSILPMPTLVVDLSICSTATTDGDLIILTKSLLMKLDMLSMLVMNTLTAIATNIMAKVLAPLGTATVPHIIITGLHALAIRSAAL